MVVTLNNAAVIYSESFRAGLELDPHLLIYEWADEHRMIPSEGSPEPGRWRSNRMPAMKEIMECLSPSHPCSRVCFIKPIQIGGTEIIINWWGFTAHLAPGPFLFVQSTGEMIKKTSKQRLAPTIKETPVLNERISPPREKDSDNTILIKKYPGGMLMLTSPTSSGLSSTPIRYLALDEIDSYDIDIDGEGDPISMAEKRCANFGNKKIFITGKPINKETSNIDKEYDKSDQRRYNVPCPHCGELQVLEWGGIKFEYDEKYNLTSEVTYICKHCSCLIDEFYKTQMLEGGIWIPENQENGQFPGFHINALYAPIGWTSWETIVKDFLEFKREKNITKQKTWTNSYLAQSWEESGKEVEYSGLYNRREEFPAQINSNIVLITAAVDVQDDRLEVKTIGWALYEESYVLEVKYLYGSPGLPAVWKNLDEFLLKTYIHERGLMRIVCAAIDTGGHHTNEVYEFVKPREELRRVYAIKGASEDGASQESMPICGKPSKQKNGVNLFVIGTHNAKDTLFYRYGIGEPGPGYIHFPMDLTEEYFKQLTAEKKKTKYVRGFPQYKWVKTRDRNEALDLFVYNIAALNIIAFMVYPNLTVIQMLDQLAKQQREMSAPEQAVKPKSRMINEGVRIE